MAALAQGLVLGGFIQGVTLDGEAFGGGPFDWLTPYTLLVAVGLAAGYTLLGSTWLSWPQRSKNRWWTLSRPNWWRWPQNTASMAWC